MNSSSFIGRDSRQRDLVPPSALAECRAVVIGVGAIGRQVALQLAAIGIPSLVLFDDDTVQVENLAAQGYWPSDLEQPKVRATAELCRRIHPDIEVMARAERFRRSSARALRLDGRLAVFSCVDSVETRTLVWESVRHAAAFLADGRMSTEVMRVLAASSPANDSYYRTTLFGSDEAFTGSCTAKATIYTASIAAGLMIHQFTRWLRCMPVDADVTVNLLSMEVSHAGIQVDADPGDASSESQHRSLEVLWPKMS